MPTISVKRPAAIVKPVLPVKKTVAMHLGDPTKASTLAQDACSKALNLAKIGHLKEGITWSNQCQAGSPTQVQLDALKAAGYTINPQVQAQAQAQASVPDVVTTTPVLTDASTVAAVDATTAQYVDQGMSPPVAAAQAIHDVRAAVAPNAIPIIATTPVTPTDKIKENAHLVGAATGAGVGFSVAGPPGAAVGAAIGFLGGLLFKNKKV
jgi:hypothetical protein